MQHCHGFFPIWFLEANCVPHLKGTAPKEVASSTLYLLVLVTVLCPHSRGLMVISPPLSSPPLFQEMHSYL